MRRRNSQRRGNGERHDVTVHLYADSPESALPAESATVVSAPSLALRQTSTVKVAPDTLVCFIFLLTSTPDCEAKESLVGDDGVRWPAASHCLRRPTGLDASSKHNLRREGEPWLGERTGGRVIEKGDLPSAHRCRHSRLRFDATLKHKHHHVPCVT